MAISWWDCQDHFPEPTCRASARRAEGLSGMASPKARFTASRRESVLDGPEHGASLTAGRACGLFLVSLRTRFADRNSRVVVAAETTASVEDGEAAVGILMHFHRRPDEVRT